MIIGQRISATEAMNHPYFSQDGAVEQYDQAFKGATIYPKRRVMTDDTDMSTGGREGSSDRSVKKTFR